MPEFQESLTFDDVLLKPAASNVLPAEVVLGTHLTEALPLGIPVISAAMDTVTEHALAIAMAQQGGVGCIHKNMEIDAQADEVRKVKRSESGMVVDPITIGPEATLADVLRIMSEKRISGIPVTEKDGKLIGIITNRDVRFADRMEQSVRELMTKERLVTVQTGVTPEEARKLLHQHRIEKLIVVDDAYRCVGLVTVKDMEKATHYPYAAKDDHGRLRVAAAVGAGQGGVERAEALLEAEVDALIVDTAHGHSKGVLETVKALRQAHPDAQIIGGNVATAEGAKALIEAGVNAVKVGIGPGSICTTRVVAGVGVPQLSAIVEVASVCKGTPVKLIADGGIKNSGDVAKAVAAGADVVMIGSLFAGTDESPGDIILYQGRSYKSYRGMGSVGAMARGSADRYFQQDVGDQLKLVPEGVEGRVPHKGPAGQVTHQLMGGLRAAMGYTGHGTLDSMRGGCGWTRITGAGLKESHVHDVTITREAPNYQA